MPTLAHPTALDAPSRGRGLPRDLAVAPVSRNPCRLAEATRAFADALRPPSVGELPARSAGPAAASVVIVTFNGLAFTRLCLESLLTSSPGGAFEAGFEMVIVDNASTDGTREYLRELEAARPEARVIFNDSNRGFAAANNQGLAAARAPLLVLLNNDTLVADGWLARLARHLEAPDAGCVGPVTNRIGNEAEIDAPVATYGEALDLADRRAATHAGRSFDIPMPAMFCLALRREVYERVGPLDERFGVGMFEDDDYAMRMRAAGCRTLCAEDTFVYHFGQASFGALVPGGEYAALFDVNRRRFEAKWGVTWRPHGRRHDRGYESLLEDVRRAVDEAVPPDATVAVISKGDERLLAQGPRRAFHFPRGADGGYPGCYPADGAAAIAQVEALRRQGVEYLVVPRPSLWWLNHYDGLERVGAAVCRRDGCVIYDLRPARDPTPERMES